MSGTNGLGAIRLHLGAEHEQAVAEKLTAYGWTVQPWGQGLFRPEVRAAIVARTPAVLWRWIPDLIAVRGRRVALIDPKSSWRRDTGNFAVEQSALIAHQTMAHLGLPIAYVFADFSGNTVERLRVVKTVHLTESVQGGSGTVFVLVRQDEQLAFDQLFGPPLQVTT